MTAPLFEPTRLPAALAAVEADTAMLGFEMSSDRDTGALLRALAASRPGPRLLELGAGTGMAAVWLLDGADRDAEYVGIDTDEKVLQIARRHLENDPRVRLFLGDGAELLERFERQGERFDLIFADAWPGKYSHLDLALSLVAPRGFFVIDDMLPQANWPEGHVVKARALLRELLARRGFFAAPLSCSTGLVVLTRRPGS